MIRTSLAATAVTAFAALSGCAVHITHTEDGQSKSQQMAGSAKFECVASPSGECHYALFTTRCDSAGGEGGKPTTTCTHQVFEQFKIAAGQSRKVSNLPAGYKQCMKSGGMPEVPSCD